MSYRVVFIESLPFMRRLRTLAGESENDVLQQIQSDLISNPEIGRIVRGLNGVRKARASNPTRGKGKRGGFRYLYLYLERRDHIHLLFLLDKDEQDDLAEDQRAGIRKMVGQIKSF